MILLLEFLFNLAMLAAAMASILLISTTERSFLVTVAPGYNMYLEAVTYVGR